MDLGRFDVFYKECSENLAGSVDKILKIGGKELPCAIGFVTTDDFYGFYLVWQYGSNVNIAEHCSWEQALYPDYLYQPLVEIVDSCTDADLCSPSNEKWDFAKSLLTVLGNCIKQLPDDIFYKNDCSREDILFFAAMSDGDYVQEMLEASVKMFNSSAAIKKYVFE